MAVSTTMQAVPAAEEKIDPRKALAFLAMVFGMFMAILDIQIVSASLAEIQAGLGASSDEISWVQTSYLIAEVVMIPLSGFLGRLLSTRVLFTVSAAGFTAASVLCATATNIEQMIVYRAIQGFIGGGMIPSVFAAAFTIFPPSKRSIVSPIVGLVATLAPTVGPTIGGYLSHAFSWHWLFLVNVGPGILVAIAAWNLIDFDKGDKSLLAKFDWWGLAGMAAFLGSLEYVLEEGPRNDWFQDSHIVIMTVVLVAGALMFFYRAFTAEEPIVDLSAFRNMNFALGSSFSFIMGVGLYGLTYLYPLYLGSIRGYDALMIGEALFVSGLAMFMTAPLAGFLSTRMDPRLMMMIGFIGFAAGTYLMTGLTADWDFYELLLPQILRGCSMMLCMVPINNLALGTLHPSHIKNASGLFNLMRNLGGAIGLAVINTMLMRRGDLHYAQLSEHLNWGNREAQEMLANLTAKFNAAGMDGANIALMKLSGMVRQQATLMSFIDVFMILTVLFVSLAFFATMMKKPGDVPKDAAGH
ncbi:DHA2 family efflux MFS transporter permease subunit [Pseudochrobactrum algeriensis]|uniref:DHA2 family efflux MFS transporter permease subunit n=1 Tax=Pseudochrobactrum algeriensis TaxID=2834768 RepID=UPI000EFA458E|nr:DHA2 family efflux MFS transporter permease subunit [Pseudochrobactrum algeriensis]QVQ36173.1 DHA2 family efflux MFS transporter permease subunit [Pseudochrobactrum algeriensis]QVQ39389.1 DHA2 family efflux MFS transporter permease subunit [Pseudochrobactrum algeriensis]QVQ43310.1 DHA2 family efflux MFS transporter permease subunit [Pseudochrobactrum algeriensis]